MKNNVRNAVTARAEAVAAAERRRALGTALRAWGRGARHAWLQVCGIPDYERYLAHRASRHPGEPVLSRREFVAQAVDRKYCKGGPRCC